VATFCCLLDSATFAQTMNSLDDFQFNPFSNPPRAQFWFRRPPAFEQSETGKDERVLTLVYPYTSNEATQAKYLRHFSEPYPLKSLEVSERDDKEGTSLVVRFALRKGFVARLLQSTGGSTMTVTFAEAPPIAAAPTAPTVEPAKSSARAPEPVVTEPDESATLSRRSDLKEQEPPKTTPPVTKSPMQTPTRTETKTQDANDGEATANAAKTSPTKPTDGNPPVSESLGRFFVPILVVAGGVVILVVALVGGGFVLVWSWVSLRGVSERRRGMSSRKVFQTAREMNRVLEQFRSASEETLQDATERHRTTIEALRRDINTVRQTVSELIAEFDRATQSVALMEPSVGTRPTRSHVGESDAPERTTNESPPVATDERRRSVRDWIARVSARVAEAGVGGTQAETLARRVEGARVDPADLLAPAEPVYSDPPVEEPDVFEEPETEPSPVEETNLYDKARSALANGAMPLDVAQRTGLSLGEVELIAQLERVRKEPKS
jgi:hypothetical protein